MDSTDGPKERPTAVRTWLDRLLGLWVADRRDEVSRLLARCGYLSVRFAGDLDPIDRRDFEDRLFRAESVVRLPMTMAERAELLDGIEGGSP